MMAEKPTSFPLSSNSAVTTILAQNREPSLRTRQPSSSKRPSETDSLKTRTGRPLCLILGCVKAAKPLAYDFLLVPAQDAFGAKVPRGNTALRIRHENRVVLQAFDHQAEALLVLADRLLLQLLIHSEQVDKHGNLRQKNFTHNRV